MVNTQKKPVHKDERPTRRRAILWIGGIILVVLLIIGALPRVIQMIELNRTHQELLSRIRSNEAVVLAAAPSVSQITLPGDIQAIQQFPILARADGYLQQRLVDIGDYVKKGQLLAVISAPDLDEQLSQGQADLRTQKANLDNAKATYAHYLAAWHAATATVLQSKANVNFDRVEIVRYEYLARQGAVSKEVRDSFTRQLEADEALLKTNQENERAAKLQADAALEQVNAAEQTVESYGHNMKRLATLQGFRNIYAPNDGVITARYVDPGGLIQSGGSGTQILAMGSLDILRVFVQVPQASYRGIAVGSRAGVTVPEFPRRVFAGVVTNVSGGLDTQSRTLQVEVHVANKDHTLPVGLYGEVRFTIPNTIPTCIVPVNAISARASGNYVAVMINGHVHFKAIDIYRDNGATVQVSTGVHAGDVVLLDPPDDLREDEPVRAVLTKTSATPS